MKKRATLFRMMSKDHICPYGIKSKHLLEKKGYLVEDHHLTSRDEIEAFKKEHNVKTTPQTFIEGERIGGYDDLVSYFDVYTLKQKDTTYQPIIAIFATTFLMALASTFSIYKSFDLISIIELFIAFSMCVLGIMKLRDLFSFSNQFIGYDLLAMKWVPYAYIYPVIETLAGILMISGTFLWVAASCALFIGTIGTISVFKAVYIDKRQLKCACVGGNSSVPLGFISLTENLMMIAMAVWIFIK